MGIYISGVKGLPEQVQENKNKIKEVEEQIEGIDFEAVRQLQGQVAENTQDINNLEASIGVQNQAINGLKNRADALESKTQKITYDENTGKTTIDSYTIINGGLDCDNVHVVGNGTFQNANGSGLHFQEGANDDEVVLVNKESGTAHDLTLHADGTLTLDGQAVGKTYYRHSIGFTYNGYYFTIEVISTKDSAYTQAELRDYLVNWNDGTLKALKYSIIGVNSSNALASYILLVNANNYLFYAGGAPVQVNSLSNYNDIVYPA